MKKIITILTFLLLTACTRAETKTQNTDTTATPTAQAKQTVARQGTNQTTNGAAANFTGVVTVESIYTPQAPSKTYASYVTFEARARTNWHSHPLGQTLIVTNGVAWTQDEFGNTDAANVGDVIHCPSNIKHWHGASADSSMTHVSISERHETARVIWLNPVTDEQYDKAGRTIEKQVTE